MKPPEVFTPRCLLRLPCEQDAQATLDYMLRNRERFAPTDPPKPPEFYTLGYFQKYGRDAAAQFEQQTTVRFNVFLHNAEAPLIGAINFTQVFLGPFRSCSLGYGIDGTHEGKGLMQECVAAAISYIFNEFKLHRVQAGHLIDNIRSAALLKRLGFSVIGIAPNYLFINGAWRDHVLTQRINPAYPQDKLLLD